MQEKLEPIFHLPVMLSLTNLNAREILNSNLKQRRQWRVGRVGNCPPRFWQNSNAAVAAAFLLAHPVLGSY